MDVLVQSAADWCRRLQIGAHQSAWILRSGLSNHAYRAGFVPFLNSCAQPLAERIVLCPEAGNVREEIVIAHRRWFPSQQHHGLPTGGIRRSWERYLHVKDEHPPARSRAIICWLSRD
jgi:hypothetical protein